MDGSNGSYKPTYTLCNVSSSSSESLGVVQAQQSAHQPQPYQNTGAPQSSAGKSITLILINPFPNNFLVFMALQKKGV